MRLLRNILRLGLALLALGSVFALVLGALGALIFALLGGGWLREQVTRVRVLLALAFLGLGGLVALVFGLFALSQAVPLPPGQPLAFPHTVHAAELGMECLACHRSADTDFVAGVPALEQCMFCHRVVGRDSPEVGKLIAAWEDGQPLDWLRITRLPDHVHFDHGAHFRAGVQCSTCHGPVEQMAAVHKVRTLEMGDCLGCHRDRGAPTECSVCHY